MPGRTSSISPGKRAAEDSSRRRPRLQYNTRSSGFSTSQEKDTAAPFDYVDRKYVVDGIQVVLSFCLHQQENHFEQLATCIRKTENLPSASEEEIKRRQNCFWV
jgi:hypothetical protein